MTISKMELILARHGETIENINKIIQGQIHGTLSKEGIEQAKKLANRLKDNNFDIIFCSDLKRAKDTAKEILKFHKNTKICYTKDLREKSWGIYNGKHRDVYDKDLEKSNESVYLFKPKDGESYAELLKRSTKFYNHLVKDYKDKNILLVSHGGFICSLLLYLSGDKWQNYREYRQENTAVSIIKTDEHNKPKIELLNCIEHLNP